MDSSRAWYFRVFAAVKSQRLWVFLACLAMLLNPGVLVRGGRWLCSQLAEDSALNLHPMVFGNVFSGIILWCLALAGLFFMLVYQLSQPDRRERVWSSLAPLGTGLAGFVWLPFAIHFQRAEEIAFPVIAENALPIMRALEQYEADNGDYPPFLEALVPNYLQRLPRPGILGASNFRYSYPTQGHNYISGAGMEKIYSLDVRFGIEDKFFYLPDAAKRQAILKSSVCSRHEHDWIFEDT